MKNLNKFNLRRLMLIGSVLLLNLVSGCRNKIGAFEICLTLENPSFYCANQAVPSQSNGFEKPYKANMICMEPSEFNKIIDEISKKDSSFMEYKLENLK